MKREIITTKDNSKTLLIPEMNETYHSSNGALTEANHIFIKNGINQYKTSSKPISIFEMGFGTGLNAILTYRFANQHQLNINYNTFEKYPISTIEMKQLNYSSALNLTIDEQITLDKMHQSINKTIELSNNFSFHLIVDDLMNFDPSNHQFDIIYFDAFAPSHQPKLWQKVVLTKMYKSLKNNGFLITYCAQGQFKRDLKSVGFEVINLPGPPGKREITKAVKN
jgi:tRNA U34 5-methylaminomethyl-2-thiouridine-forming methyltransferase MnmC